MHVAVPKLLDLTYSLFLFVFFFPFSQQYPNYRRGNFPSAPFSKHNPTQALKYFPFPGVVTCMLQADWQPPPPVRTYNHQYPSELIENVTNLSLSSYIVKSHFMSLVPVPAGDGPTLEFGNLVCTFQNWTKRLGLISSLSLLNVCKENAETLVVWGKEMSGDFKRCCGYSVQ